MLPEPKRCKFADSMTTKKSIVQVSRAWKEMGLELLFEHLYFPEDSVVDRMSMIVEQFENSSLGELSHQHGYGWWTRKVDVCGTPDVAVFIRLLRSCHNLDVLHLHLDSNDFDLFTSHELASISSIIETRFSNSLRNLAYNIGQRHLSDSSQFNHHLYLPNIQLDSLDISVFDNTTSFSATQPPAFSNCSTVLLRIMECISEFPPWKFPSLRHLSLDSICNSDVDPLTPFIQEHGSQLASLAITISSPNEHSFGRVSDLLKYTPNLTTLSFDPWSIDDMDVRTPELESFPSVRYLTLIGDLLTPSSHADEINPPALGHRAFLADVLRNMFPNLRCVRILDRFNPWAMPGDISSGWSKELIRNFAALFIRLEDGDGDQIVV